MQTSNVPFWAVVAALVACGARGASTGGQPGVSFDRDPLILIPGSAVLAAAIDARGAPDGGPPAPTSSSSASSALVTSIADWFIPLADDSVPPTRDVERVLLAIYATGGADVAAVFSGRFDIDKIAGAPQSRSGAPIARGGYAGFTTYTVGPVTFAPLTRNTLVAGMGDGLRRVLERVRDGKLERSISPWMVDTLESPGAQIAAAVDLASQPIAAATLGSMSLPWLEGMRVARIIGNFQPPGVNVAATLTYGDPQQAQAGAEGARVAGGLLNRLSPLLGGIKLQNLAVGAEGNDLRCKFAVDDQALRAALALATRLLPTAIR